MEIFSLLGFTPGQYTGAVPWDNAAWIAPLTSLFLHGSWMHIAFNLVMLLAMGTNFERNFGTRRTAIFYFASGLAGCLTCLAFSPSSAEPVIGASGAISGIFGVTFLMLNERGVLGTGTFRKPLPFILLWIALIVGTGMLLGGNIAWQAHLGGFLGGLALFTLWRKQILKF